MLLLSQAQRDKHGRIEDQATRAHASGVQTPAFDGRAHVPAESLAHATASIQETRRESQAEAPCSTSKSCHWNSGQTVTEAAARTYASIIGSSRERAGQQCSGPSGGLRLRLRLASRLTAAHSSAGAVPIRLEDMLLVFPLVKGSEFVKGVCDTVLRIHSLFTIVF